MGANTSKIAHKGPELAIVDDQAQQSPENTNVKQESIPTTPVLTPKCSRENIGKENLDPRSPSKHIARTPMELLPAAAEKLKSLTSENCENEETPLKKHVLLGFDPRSPSFEFQRTPIVVSTSPDKKLPEIIRNKNLDKVLKCALPNSPKLLDNYLITPKLKADAYKRKSFVLLETNIDYTETDLDNVIRQKYLGKSLQNLCASGELIYKEINDPRSPTADFPRTPIQICQEEVQTIEGPSLQNENKNVNLEEPDNIQKGETSITIEKLSNIEAKPAILTYINKEDSIAEDVPKVQSDNHSVSESQQSDKVEKEIEPHPITLKETLLKVNGTETQETPGGKTSQTITNQKLALSPVLKQQTKAAKSAPVSPSSVSVTPESEQQSDSEVVKETEQHAISSKELVLKFDEAEIQETISAKTVQECKQSSPTITRQKLVLSPILKQRSKAPKSAPVSPPSIVSVTPKKPMSQPVTPPVINLTADVKELDKKLTHLIYEDEKDLVVCPRTVKVNDQNRTPLGLRNGTENKKPTRKLKVSDKPRKAEYAVSKIPVFKEKKIKVQCENTPPRSMRPKKSQWDAKDDTLVI